jgi:hypothetical protein
MIGRVLAAHVLGLDEVPCIVLAHLTAQRRAYVLADNKLALNAGWDLEMPTASSLASCRSAREVWVRGLTAGASR